LCTLKATWSQAFGRTSAVQPTGLKYSTRQPANLIGASRPPPGRGYARSVWLVGGAALQAAPYRQSPGGVGPHQAPV